MGAILTKKEKIILSIKMKELPELERPYEKLELYGEKVLSNAELLAIIIKTGNKEESSLQLAQRILNLDDSKTGDLDFLQNVSIEELMKIKGIGKVKALQLKAVCELAIRMSRPSNYKKLFIKSTKDVAKLLMNEMRFQKKEIVKIIILNSENEIIAIKDLSMGIEKFVSIGVKSILSEPIKLEAPKFVLVHNHPSGNPTPSDVDIEFTELLLKACKIVGIHLVDHVIIGDLKYKTVLEEVELKKEEQKQKL